MDVSRVIDNRTLLNVRATPVDDRDGREVLLVVAKMTWDVDAIGNVQVAKPAPIRFAAMTRDGSSDSSQLFPDDAVPHKPGTDVLLVGHAHPRAGQKIQCMDVSLRVEAAEGRRIAKKVRVHGERQYKVGLLGGVTVGPAAPLSKTPLVYELAYGGRDDTDPTAIRLDERNPIGRGFRRDKMTLIGAPAPQLEDPSAPLDSRQPAPAGFGPIAAHWSPRWERFGTMDDAWALSRAPVKPADFDARYFSCAPEDQWLETPMVGDEPVEVLGATPEGVWRFRLPRYAPRFVSRIRGTESTHATHLDTFFIDADRRVVELCWRIAVPLPQKTEFLETVQIWEVQPPPSETLENLKAQWPEAS